MWTCAGRGKGDGCEDEDEDERGEDGMGWNPGFGVDI